MTDADERRVAKALQGLEFPADREDIITFARDRDAHEKTMSALFALPAGRYENTEDVERAVPQQPKQTR